MKLKVFSDGGSRGNPGPAAIGVVIRFEDDIIKEISNYLGTKTNNQAEYEAVVAALEWIRKDLPLAIDINITEDQDTEIDCFLDSQLVVEQLNGRYKIKNEGLRPLFDKVRELIAELGGKVTFKYIPREENKDADTLVNRALDEKSK